MPRFFIEDTINGYKLGFQGSVKNIEFEEEDGPGPIERMFGQVSDLWVDLRGKELAQNELQELI